MMQATIIRTEALKLAMDIWARRGDMSSDGMIAIAEKGLQTAELRGRILGLKEAVELMAGDCDHPRYTCAEVNCCLNNVRVRIAELERLPLWCSLLASGASAYVRWLGSCSDKG